MSIYIIINGIKLIKEASSPLIGEPPSKEFTEEITNKILSYECVLGIHDLVIHNYGPGRNMASIHAEVPNDVDIEVSHEIIDRIERDAIKMLGMFLVIHMDPVETKNEYVLKVKSQVEQFVRAFSVF